MSSTSSAPNAPQPLGHGTTITIGLVGALLFSALGAVSSYVATQADVRYQGRDIEQLREQQKADRAEISQSSQEIRVVLERLGEQKRQLDRIESKIDAATFQPAIAPVRRAAVAQP